MIEYVGVIAIVVVVIIFGLVVGEDYIAPILGCEHFDGQCVLTLVLDDNTDHHVSLTEQLRVLANQPGER